MEQALREWTLQPGGTIRRVELHDRYGGRRQGGIAPTAGAGNVLIFTERKTGELHGYFDRWDSDGIFHYTGEGQRGDQRMVSGNRAILNHRELDQALRVFEGVRGTVRYLGEFELVGDPPWY